MPSTVSSLSRREVLRTIADYLYLTLGLFLYAVGWVFFLLPYSLMSGGLTGICSLIFYATGFQPSWSYFIVNVLLLSGALKILGLKFLTRTIFGMIMLSSFAYIIQTLLTQDDGTLYQLLGPNEVFMSIALGGLVCGTALAIIFLHNGSTGGTDIIAASINKYRDISLGRVFIVLDLTIIGSSVLVLHDWRTMVLGYCFAILENVVLDYVMTANQASVQFFIFSKRYKDIAHEIGTSVQRGITILDGHGWYSGQEVKVLCILARKRESVLILRIIKAIDPNAFVSIGTVSGVYGEGFDKIKLKPQAPPTPALPDIQEG